MDIIRQFKIPILIFLAGMFLSIAGAWMKIMHMAFADGLLTAGMLLKGVAVIVAIYLLVKQKK